MAIEGFPKGSAWKLTLLFYIMRYCKKTCETYHHSSTFKTGLSNLILILCFLLYAALYMINAVTWFPDVKCNPNFCLEIYQLI